MRFLLVLSSFCFLILFSTQSCQKDNDPPFTDTLVISHTDTLFHSDTVYIKEPTSIFGLWVGTYDVTTGPVAGNQDLYYSYELHTDSTIQMVGLAGGGVTNYGNGTWHLQGTVFSAHIVTINLSDAGTAQTVTGTYDSTTSKLSGIVKNDGTAAYEASFVLEKVQ